MSAPDNIMLPINYDVVYPDKCMFESFVRDSPPSCLAIRQCVGLIQAFSRFVDESTECRLGSQQFQAIEASMLLDLCFRVLRREIQK
jgi:hypothetical protein